MDAIMELSDYKPIKLYYKVTNRDKNKVKLGRIWGIRYGRTPRVRLAKLIKVPMTVVQSGNAGQRALSCRAPGDHTEASR